MTADVSVSPPARSIGISQQELVEFATRLAEQGTPREAIARITDTLQTIANEAATAATFRGATQIALTLEATRQQISRDQAEYVDHALRTLRTTIQATPATLGHINKTAVIAAINGMLTTPEPTIRSTRIITQER